MARPAPASTSWKHTALIFLLIFAGLLALHLPLLRLPYYWDEAGYYVPAARDLLLTGSLIPHTTPSNAHPPLVMAYLALLWKAFGYSVSVTRIAMLVVAAFALLGLYRLAERISNRKIATASVICTAVYPIFFVQSSLAQVDLLAAGFTFWGLFAYAEEKRWQTVAWFALTALAKETAILAPVALLGMECSAGIWPAVAGASRPRTKQIGGQDGGTTNWALLLPIIPLALWFAFHRAKTGFTFGNPEFFRYNVQATTNPLRVFFAFLMRLWQTFGHMNMYLLTISTLGAMWLPPLADQGEVRPRIDLHMQFAFLAVAVIYIAALSVIGGAVLSRYMLPVVPLVIVVSVSTLWRRVRFWKWIIAVVVLGFATGLFVNPPYGFSFEDNLAYRDFIVLHQDAEAFLETRYPSAHVLTAWPATGELSQPWLGYVSRPMRIVQIENFTTEQMMSAADAGNLYDAALVFDTKYEPPNPLIARWPAWEKIKERFFGYHRDLPPLAAAQILGGRVVYSETRNGQWAAVIVIDRIEQAKLNH